jgi:hypothetical protein
MTKYEHLPQTETMFGATITQGKTSIANVFQGQKAKRNGLYIYIATRFQM